MLSGCGENNKNIMTQLNSVTISNILPKVEEDASYAFLEDIEDMVYEQQLSACKMYADTYAKTYYQQFIEDEESELSRSSGKVANTCTEKRKDIFEEIEIAFAINIYRLVRDVKDCTNIDAYVVKTHNDVLDFYDIYNKYLECSSAEEDDVLLDILLEYYERSNILAFKFLKEHNTEIVQAVVKRIENNAAAEENLRICMSQNNMLIKVLNEVYGGVSEEYAEKITELNNSLAKKLLMSMDTLTEKEREEMLEQLNPSTPTPEPTQTPGPTETPKPTNTPAPLATRIPTPTPKPATPKPTSTPRPIPTSEPTEKPQTATSAPTEEPYEPIFGFGDDNDEDDGGYMFE